MLKRSDLDQIDRFLMGATLQDAIKLVQVCQALTAECRLMLDVIDQRTEDFFSGNSVKEVRTGGGQGGDASAGPRGQDAASDSDSVRPLVHATRDSVSDSRSEQPSQESAAAVAGGDSSPVGGSAKRVGRRNKKSPLGGEVRTGSEVPEERSSDGEPDPQPVKRKRGRPRKKPLEDSNAGSNSQSK